MEIGPCISKELSDLPITFQLMELLDFLNGLYQLSEFAASHCVIVVVYVSCLLGYLPEPRLDTILLLYTFSTCCTCYYFTVTTLLINCYYIYCYYLVHKATLIHEKVLLAITIVIYVQFVLLSGHLQGFVVYRQRLWSGSTNLAVIIC